MSATYGEMIRCARLAQGISQTEMARMLQTLDGRPLDKAYLCHIERGDYVPASGHLHTQFSEILGLDLEALAALAVREHMAKMEAKYQRAARRSTPAGRAALAGRGEGE